MKIVRIVALRIVERVKTEDLRKLENVRKVSKLDGDTALSAFQK